MEVDMQKVVILMIYGKKPPKGYKKGRKI